MDRKLKVLLIDDHPLVRDVDIAAGVRESPGIRNLNSVLTLRLRFTLTRL